MTFYFFDLETSGFSARDDRIMQFAGQRTDMELKPIGEPDNILIKLTPDILPQPDAVLVHGITPQKTLIEGISETELVKYLTSQVFTPDTIAVGYNNIRFDDEFIRFLFWRNFNDAYEWSWKNGCSRWDLLDMTRMTRALRPDGINWPFAADGKPTNRLEALAVINKLDHVNAHDALSDVEASIALAKLIKTKQPELFAYLLNIRDKNKLRPLLESGKPFMYTSGRYSSDFLHTTAAVMLGPSSREGQILVYDLRYDPEPYLKMTQTELIDAWKWTKDPDVVRLPVKTLKYNRCPAILPGVVKDKATLNRLLLSRENVSANLLKLQKAGPRLLEKLLEVVDQLDKEQNQRQASIIGDLQLVDKQLYDGFINGEDKTKMSVVRAATKDDIGDLHLDFQDERLKLLFTLYKARNFPKTLDQDEKTAWDNFRKIRLIDDKKADNFFKRLEEISKSPDINGEQRYLLEELNLYAQSVLPTLAG